MKFRILSLLLGTLICSSAAYASTAVVTAHSGLNFRSRPNGHVLRTLRHGETVEVLKKSGSWEYVRLSNGQKGYVFARHTQATTESGYCYECSRARVKANPAKAILAKAKQARSSYVQGKFAPIMQPFLSVMRQCAPGCNYESWGVWGDLRHQKKRSCHNSGSAIDIPGIRCDGRSYRAGSSRYNRFVSCVRSQPGLYVIHGKGEHKLHAHISLRSCEVGGKGKVRLR